MHRPALALLGLLSALGTAQQDAAPGDMLKYMNRIPQCAMTCIMEEVPKYCTSVTNTTCICTNEPLRQATGLCIKNTCESMLDGIEAAKIEAEACNRPIRDRSVVVMASIPIQVIASITVLLRFLSRWMISRQFEADDWIMVVCMVLQIPFCVIGTTAGRLAFGRDIWTISPDVLTTALKYFYISQTLYLICLTLPKVALLAFFLRIFPDETFCKITRVVLILTCLSTTAMTLAQVFQCIPFSYNWEGWLGDFGPHRCIDLNALALTSAAFSIVQDVVILVLPLPTLLTLQLSWRTKAGIIFMLSLGVFILITSCIRLRYVIKFATSSNPTWDYFDAIIWSGTEISVSMIVVSLPAIRLLVSRVMPGVFSTLASKAGWSFPGSAKTVQDTGSIQRPNGRLPNSFPHLDQVSDEEGQDVEKGNGSDARQTRPRRSIVSSMSLYRIGSAKTARINESEEALELGDRIRGEVHTEVGVDSGRSSPRHSESLVREEDMGGSSRTEMAIRVRTTTTINSL